MNDLRVTVTVDDLDAAIMAIEVTGDLNRSGQCVMAQAMRRATGAPASCGLSTADSRGISYRVPAEAEDLINLFDNQAYDVLRELLPVTFVMEALS
jgi:hypothetical protein